MIFIRHMYRHVWRLGSDKKKRGEGEWIFLDRRYVQVSIFMWSKNIQYRGKSLVLATV